MTTITENDLHAYVDGHLDDARRVEVEAHLLLALMEILVVLAVQEQHLQ